MAANNSGIKISVQDDKKGDMPVKKTAPKPKAKAKTMTKSAIKSKQIKKLAVKPKPKSLPKIKSKTAKGGGAVKFILAMIVPATIVGAGIYVWQQNIAKETVISVRQEAQENETSFEDRLRNLKNKLTGVEDENQKLKKQSEEMTKRVALLDKAKIDFSDADLKIAFTYPAVFGEVIITNTEVASGTKFIGTFSDNEKLIFGGVSADLELDKKNTDTVATTDNQGYRKEKDDYYFRSFGEDEYEINPAEVFATKSGEALLIDKNSFVINPEADGLPVDIGGNVVALVNMDHEKYKGFAFMNSDFGIMPLESFKQMVMTINSTSL